MKRPTSPDEALERLEAKARRGARAVDVEDLLALAAAREPGRSARLRALAAGWPLRGREPGSAARVPPLGRWAAYVCAALEGGPDAVVALARTAEERALDAEDGFGEASLALGVLAAIPTEESVRGVLALAADAAADLDGRRALAVGCASALNELTALGDPVAVGDEPAAAARAFLHALLARPLATAEAAVACCALRGVGDAASLEVLARVPELPRPWAGTVRAAAGAIRARLRARGPAR